MTKFWRMLASYGRVVATTTLTVMAATGHIPATGAEWIMVGKGALLAFIPVVIRYLNPNDPAYGVGSPPSDLPKR
jgi:hypothetical protein